LLVLQADISISLGVQRGGEFSFIEMISILKKEKVLIHWIYEFAMNVESSKNKHEFLVNFRAV